MWLYIECVLLLGVAAVLDADVAKTLRNEGSESPPIPSVGMHPSAAVSSGRDQRHRRSRKQPLSSDDRGTVFDQKAGHPSVPTSNPNGEESPANDFSSVRSGAVVARRELDRYLAAAGGETEPNDSSVKLSMADEPDELNLLDDSEQEDSSLHHILPGIVDDIGGTDDVIVTTVYGRIRGRRVTGNAEAGKYHALTL